MNDSATLIIAVSLIVAKCFCNAEKDFACAARVHGFFRLFEYQWLLLEGMSGLNLIESFRLALSPQYVKK